MNVFAKLLARACGLAALALVLAGCSESASSSAAGKADRALIEPNLAVGKVRAGMNLEQVVALLGQPKRQTASAATYPSLGLAVMLDPKGNVIAVCGGDVMGPRGPFVEAFTAQTREGLGMNSTADQIIAVYGQPSQRERNGLGVESMRYPNEGLSFTLEKGRVYHMVIGLSGEAPPPKSIIIDLNQMDVKK